MLKQTKILRRFYTLRTLAATFLLVGLISGAVVVHADQFDEQINALNAQNGANRNAVNGLASQAGTYQEAIGVLQSQINGLQVELNANVARQTDLQAQIAAKQAEVDKQKAYLGEDIRTMYIDGQLTTIEELATSKDLSDYVDKESYRTTVQNKIDASIKQIAALQAKLQKQKSELDVLVNSQKQQNEQLANAKYQQDQLLAYNQGQQAAYNQQIKANSGKIAELRRQQIAANSRFIGGGGGGSPCGGGYPGVWCNAPMDSIVDTWGMYNRECVSYTAFRVAASGRYMPYWGGIGNANQWDNNAVAAGIPVDSNPRPGDVAISNAGFYGHAMYVEAVNGDGTIFVSQYNADFRGTYSTKTISPGGLNFIHF